MLPDIKAARILLVEDDLEVVEQVNSVLRAAGYAVENAYNCGDAISVDHGRFVLAIVNSTMHDRDGFTILDYAKAHPTFAHLPLLTLDKLTSDASTRPRVVDKDALLAHIAQLVRREQPDKAPTVSSQLAAMRPSSTSPFVGFPDTSAAEADAQLDRQLEALKTLSALGRSISSVLDLNEVLNQIVEAATTLTRAEEGMLLLPDEEDKALYLRAMKGVSDDSASNFRIKSDDTLVGKVYRSGEPALVGDQGLVRVKTEYFVKSLVYVPMKYQGRTIGVLGVNNRHSVRIFTPNDQELLLDLAAHAAITIENARLYEERLMQNRRLTTLVETGMAVNSTLALPDVLLTFCRRVIEAFNVNGCLISQLDAANNYLRPLACSQLAVWRMHRAARIVLDERPMLKEALSQNAFYVVGREQKGAQWRAEITQLESSGACAMIALPIRVGNQRSLGVLELYYRSAPPDDITSEFRARLRSIALEVCAMVTQKSDTRPTASLFGKAQQILDLSGAAWLCISLLADDNELEQIVKCGAAVFLEAPLPQYTPVSAEIERLFDDQSPLNYHAREPDIPDAIRAMMAGHGAEAMLCLPLFIKSKPFGMFTIYSTWEARHFRPDEISLGWALITQAASALENANLYRDLERSLHDLKQAQASLVQAARLSTMGQLAAVVAHQINNPLTTVMVDSELILQDLPSDSSLRDSVLAIRRAGQRAHAVVKRLLSTARRSEPGEELQWIEVNQTIHNTLELVTTHIERAKITIEVDLDESAPAYTLASPGHLEDVWLNLLLNGRDALGSKAGAWLGIVSRRSSDYIEVIVQDNGPGIPPENLNMLFEPFFTTKLLGEGTGLGLYICRQVIDQCRGKITVESVLGKGTAFRIILPTRA